jgi:LTXXQ motif family protein
MSVAAPTSRALSMSVKPDGRTATGWLRRSRSGIGIAAIAVIAIAALTIEAEGRARGGGGAGASMGGRGGGMSIGGRGGGGGPGLGRIRGGGPSVRSFSGPRIGGAGVRVRSHGGHRLVRHTVHTPGMRSVVRAAPGRSGSRFATVSTRGAAAPGSLARNITRGQAVLGRRAIANAAWRSAIGPVRFNGRFRGSPWPWWYGGIVCGWVGPVFWPYAYYDFFDYVFWPYAYDDFWLYAYDDVYYGIYGPYAYAAAPLRAAPRRTARAHVAQQRPAGICSGYARNLTDWPIERIAETVQPSEAQRTALDALSQANAKAVELLRTACPNDLPSVPTGRLAAMEIRLEAMLAAVRAVRPALEGFYKSLGDEQKARFNAVAPRNEAAAGKDQRDLTRLCDARSPGVADLPIDRIARAVQPSEPQRAALDELKEASLKAAAALKTDCPTYRALTPIGRVEIMEQRLEATLAAVKTVKPALDKFYDMLSDEQKARFNELRSAGAAQG